MIKKLELIGPSCLTKAAGDEPIFVLRANDELAPRVVRWWAATYLLTKATDITLEQLTKAKEALALADEMEKWKNANR